MINGIEKQLDSQTVSELIKALALSEELVVVEVNGSIVDRPFYNAFELDQESVVEIVSFVGGG
ncbi:MAG: sulfur carrier protein ThiS [Desulfamplus sp.]|nr:sulfur carrier protein ThiS [Desulfamplus sp.]